jgi:hypothetical protein
LPLRVEQAAERFGHDDGERAASAAGHEGEKDVVAQLALIGRGAEKGAEFVLLSPTAQTRGHVAREFAPAAWLGFFGLGRDVERYAFSRMFDDAHEWLFERAADGPPVVV